MAISLTFESLFETIWSSCGAPRATPKRCPPVIEEEYTMKILTILIASSLVLVLSACNTVKGAGQDIQKVGEKIEDAAKKK